MYEFHTMPPTTDIMRHAAARRQHQAVERCLALQSRTSRTITAGFTTALQLLGTPLPDSSAVDAGTLHVVTYSHATRLNVSGVRCHAWSNVDTPGAVIDVFGIECLSPEAAFAHMGRHVPLQELVALADSLMCRDEALRRTTRKSLARFLHDCTPFAGRTRCLRALRLAREGTDSPRETALRLALQQEGFPEMTVNHQIHTDEGPRYLDLAAPDYRIAIEYDGSHHALRIEDDRERLNDIQSRLWTVFTADNRTLTSTISRNRFMDSIERAFINAGARFDRVHRSLEWLSDGRRHRTSSPYFEIEK